MNQLIEKFGDRLAVLAFPCNQFGHQENTTHEELLNSLKHVRPGNNFEPKMEMFSKVDVNGSTTHNVFKVLKETLPLPVDDATSFMADPSCIIWSPVTRADIAWNFEKFLVDTDGKPVKRFSKKFPTKDLDSHIASLLE
ncbi:Glutathione peroxidase 1 [Chionoecetes opilio]|uniref:Glutathione peroxidase n=1 Tax=Chionoecetes opilio TaxID=41210 RepID=A0A8J4XSH0_CHIOP|nr:Glutathione peroxidase 1 [Chionoecetes opilio]